MGIPKKGSRKFSLDGRNYRYIITSNHRKDDDSRAVIQEDTDDGGNILGFKCGAIITPETIKVAIQMAITKGWEPSKKGAPFILGSI